ncbi:MAG: GNAT family N-acetyltransferase [Antricoccus sp.]
MYDTRTPITPNNLPNGISAAQLRREDLPEVLALVHAREIAVSGEPRETIGFVAEQLDTDAGRKRTRSLVLRHDSDVIAYVFDHHNLNERYWSDVVIDPSLGKDQAAALWRCALTWIEAVSFDDARGRQVDHIRIDISTNGSDSSSLTNLAAHGFERVRAFIDMRIDLATYEAPEPATELTIRLADVSDRDGADVRTVYDIVQASFQDHFDWATRDFDEWVAMRMLGSHAQLDNWTIAMIDGIPVGAAIHDAHRVEAAQSWYIANLGVLRSGRGRGVAKALLHDSFRRAQAAGCTGVELDVDAESPTGATYLYESVGMHRTATWWDYQKHYNVLPMSTSG